MRVGELILIFLGFIFCVLALFTLISPWYKVESLQTYGNSSKVEIVIKYMLSGKIKAYKFYSNESNNLPLNTHIGKLPNGAEKSRLVSLFNNSYIVAVSGAVLAFVAFAFLVISKITAASIPAKFKKISRHIFLVASILFLLAQVYFTIEVFPAITKLESIAPLDIVVLPGSKLSSFYGASNSLTYSPALGWYTSFAAFLMGVLYYRAIKNLKN